MEIGTFTTNKYNGKAIIKVDNLSVRFRTFEGEIQALSNISFDLEEGEILGISWGEWIGKVYACHFPHVSTTR
ncbi:hypothetical protein B2A_11650, partial [mine drainage metagenome]